MPEPSSPQPPDPSAAVVDLPAFPPGPDGPSRRPRTLAVVVGAAAALLIGLLLVAEWRNTARYGRPQDPWLEALVAAAVLTPLLAWATWLARRAWGRRRSSVLLVILTSFAVLVVGFVLTFTLAARG